MKKFILAGIKERINDLLDEDVYFNYGRLIAEGKVDYSLDVVSDAVKLYKSVGKPKENNILDW